MMGLGISAIPPMEKKRKKKKLASINQSVIQKHLQG
jgi:hypothetical protein